MLKERPIKSFVLRQGRLSNAQQDALDKLWGTYGLELTAGILDFSKIFNRKANTIIEIGFGMGTSLAIMAEDNPHQNYIGIEVHRPGVGALLKLVAEKKITNIRVFNADAIEVLAQKIPKNSLTAVYLFFPDPWHKTKHKKRRILQPEFALTIASYLQKGGVFHMATDWQDYAKYMLKTMSAVTKYENLSGVNNYTPRPKYRPLTKFEQRGYDLGHNVWDLIFINKGT
jgi:tRNA (guanine-N7-)-methyltransferase